MLAHTSHNDRVRLNNERVVTCVSIYKREGSRRVSRMAAVRKASSRFIWWSRDHRAGAPFWRLTWPSAAMLINETFTLGDAAFVSPYRCACCMRKPHTCAHVKPKKTRNKNKRSTVRGSNLRYKHAGASINEGIHVPRLLFFLHRLAYVLQRACSRELAFRNYFPSFHAFRLISYLLLLFQLPSSSVSSIAFFSSHLTPNRFASISNPLQTLTLASFLCPLFSFFRRTLFRTSATSCASCLRFSGWNTNLMDWERKRKARRNDEVVYASPTCRAWRASPTPRRAPRLIASDSEILENK